MSADHSDSTLGVEQAARELFSHSQSDERWEEIPADERDWHRERVRDILAVYRQFAEQPDAEARCRHEWVTRSGETTCKLCEASL